ncbi:unnamed protein product, partial [Heterotrigona itama]
MHLPDFIAVSIFSISPYRTTASQDIAINQNVMKTVANHNDMILMSDLLHPQESSLTVHFRLNTRRTNSSSNVLISVHSTLQRFPLEKASHPVGVWSKTDRMWIACDCV